MEGNCFFSFYIIILQSCRGLPQHPFSHPPASSPALHAAALLPDTFPAFFRDLFLLRAFSYLYFVSCHQCFGETCICNFKLYLKVETCMVLNVSTSITPLTLLCSLVLLCAASRSSFYETSQQSASAVRISEKESSVNSPFFRCFLLFFFYPAQQLS